MITFHIDLGDATVSLADCEKRVQTRNNIIIKSNRDNRRRRHRVGVDLVANEKIGRI